MTSSAEASLGGKAMGPVRYAPSPFELLIIVEKCLRPLLSFSLSRPEAEGPERAGGDAGRYNTREREPLPPPGRDVPLLVDVGEKDTGPSFTRGGRYWEVGCLLLLRMVWFESRQQQQ